MSAHTVNIVTSNGPSTVVALSDASRPLVVTPSIGFAATHYPFTITHRETGMAMARATTLAIAKRAIRVALPIAKWHLVDKRGFSGVASAARQREGRRLSAALIAVRGMMLFSAGDGS